MVTMAGAVYLGASRQTMLVNKIKIPQTQTVKKWECDPWETNKGGNEE